MFRSLSIFALASCLAIPAFAQQPPQIPADAMREINRMQSMSPSDQQMQAQRAMMSAQEMQKCVSEMEQNETQLKALEDRSRQMEAELKQLCAAGKKTEATSRAHAYGAELSRDPSMQKMQECSKLMAGMMPQFENNDPSEKYQKTNICAEFETNAAQ